MLGTHLLYQLTLEGKAVKALKRHGSDTSTVQEIFQFYGDSTLEQYKRIQWVTGDVLDYDSLADALESVDTIYHTAAMVSFHTPRHQDMWAINVEGTKNLLDAAMEKKVGVFCHASSIATLGNSVNGSPITEDDLWQADDRHSAYSRSKFRSEMEVWRASKEGLNTVIVNPSVIIGPGAKNSSSSKIIKLANSGLPFYTNGKTGYVDVRDVARAMVTLVENKIYGERFILSAENKSAHEMLQLMARHLNVKSPNIQAKAWMLWLGMVANRFFALLTGQEPILTRESIRSTMGHSHYSSEKINQQLGWKFIPISESVGNAIAFHKQQNNRNSRS